MTGRLVMVVTVIGALAAFCIVQDLVTARGAREYVRLQQAAIAGHGPRVAVNDVMRPAIDASVRDGLLCAGGVVLVGLAVAARGKWSRW